MKRTLSALLLPALLLIGIAQCRQASADSDLLSGTPLSGHIPLAVTFTNTVNFDAPATGWNYVTLLGHREPDTLWSPVGSASASPPYASGSFWMCFITIDATGTWDFKCSDSGPNQDGTYWHADSNIFTIMAY